MLLLTNRLSLNGASTNKFLKSHSNENQQAFLLLPSEIPSLEEFSSLLFGLLRSLLSGRLLLSRSCLWAFDTKHCPFSSMLCTICKLSKKPIRQTLSDSGKAGKHWSWEAPMQLTGTQDLTKLNVSNKEESKLGLSVSRLLPRSATKDKLCSHSISIPCKSHVTTSIDSS